MTESEWLASGDPSAMLLWATGYVDVQSDYRRNVRLGDRKLRLFACAAARLLDSRHPERGAVIEACEAVADGKKSVWGGGLAGLVGARKSIDAVWGWTWCCTAENVVHGLRDTLIQMRGNAGSFYRQGEVAAVLRDLVGNPFRPVRWSSCDHCHGTGWRTKIDRDNPGGSVSRPCRKCGPNPTVLSLATAAYEDRLPDGALDPVRLAVLSDALEEAGCADESILMHLRGLEWYQVDPDYYPDEVVKRRLDNPAHYRGCRVVDLILGRE